MSDDSKYFLFENKDDEKFTVYTLDVRKQKLPSGNLMKNLDIFLKNKLVQYSSSRVNDLYDAEFVELFSVDFHLARFRIENWDKDF